MTTMDAVGNRIPQDGESCSLCSDVATTWARNRYRTAYCDNHRERWQRPSIVAMSSRAGSAGTRNERCACAWTSQPRRPSSSTLPRTSNA